jgi:hypothetical protein
MPYTLMIILAVLTTCTYITVRTPTTLTYVRVIQDGDMDVLLSSFAGLFR